MYIIILPSFGIVSEVIPAFSRKPIFGYTFMVFSGIAIGFMGWGVWAHHMFVSGIGPISVAAFSLAAMFIAVPTGVKILNWLATMWGGKLRFTTAMLFATGTVAMFTIGGLSGVTHSLAPADTQQTDTYYIVAHFHYVIFGGGVFGLFAGAYFWWPKVFGHFLNERRGRSTSCCRVQQAFGPMRPWPAGHEPPNRHLLRRVRVRTLEPCRHHRFVHPWLLGPVLPLERLQVQEGSAEPSTSSCPVGCAQPRMVGPVADAEHNFDEIPVIESQDDWWFRKYNINEDGSVVRIATAEEAAQKGDAEGVHLPSPSFWPLVLAIGLPLIGYGVIFNLWLCCRRSAHRYGDLRLGAGAGRRPRCGASR